MPGDPVMEAAFADAEIQQEVDEFVKGDQHTEGVVAMDVSEGKDVLTSTARGKPLWNRETGVSSMVLTDQAKLRLGQVFPIDIKGFLPMGCSQNLIDAQHLKPENKDLSVVLIVFNDQDFLQLHFFHRTSTV